MPIDDIKFGEMIGTVGALVTAVADMKAAIIPALREQRLEMAKYREDCQLTMKWHEKDDLIMHEKLEIICKPIADIQDWMLGDGTPEDLGAKKILNLLVTDKIKDKAWVAGIATVVSGAIGSAAWAFETFHK